MTNDIFKKANKKLDLIFAESPEKLLINIKTHLEKESLQPVSLDIIREHNKFCAVIVGEPKEKYID